VSPLTEDEPIAAGRATLDQPPPRADFLGSTVLDLLARTVASSPDHLAVRSGNIILSYGELDSRSDAMALWLASRFAVAPGDVVAVRTSRSAAMLVALLAVLKSGAVFLPVHRQAPAARVRALTARTGARVAIGVDGAAGYEALTHVPPSGTPPPSGPAGRRPHPSDPAYVIQTSGSTGEPKAVLLAHEGLANTVLEHVERLALSPADRCLLFMAPSFDGALLDVFMAWAAGATLVVADEESVGATDRLAALIQRERISVTTITPSYLALLDPAAVARLRLLVSAGEALPAPLAARLLDTVELWNGYGPTEATVNAALHRVRGGDAARPAQSVPIGAPGANKRIYLLDHDGAPVPVGATGEICIAGTGVGLGYVGDPAGTAARFVPDPFAPGQRMYRSGDLGVRDADGILSFTGRADRQVKINGYRIDPSEIEAAIESEPRVAAARVVPRGEGPAELVAFILPSGDIAPAEIRRHLEARLPPAMLPHRFFEIERWPLTAHDKIDDAALLRLAESESPLDVVPAGTPVEEALRTIWCEVLDRAHVGLDEDVFAAGGDSIRLMRIAHAARALDLIFTPADLARTRTIRNLAQVSARGGPTPPLPPARPTAPEIARLPVGIEHAYPASRMQSWMIERHRAGHRVNGAYVGCAEWRLENESLDESALAAAVERLCHLHASLRTSFQRSCQGRDLALIHPAGPVDVAREDLRRLSPAAADDHVRGLIAEACARGFDPYAGAPPFRFRLLRRSETEVSLFLSFHHALLDGWSGIELRNGLFELYRTVRNGEPAGPPLADSCAEFVALEQEVVRPGPARAFWDDALAAPAATAALEATRRRFAPAAAGPGPHATLDRPIGPAFVEAAVRSSSARAAGVKAVVLAATVAALRDILHLDALALAAVANGRSERMREPFRSTGLFWNIVPLIFGDGRADAATAQARLDSVAPHANFPLGAIEEEILEQPLVAPVFNFVQFHNAGEGARRVREGIVQSRFDFPLTVFVNLPPGPSTAAGKLRIDWDLRIMTDAEAAALADRLLATLLAGER